MKYSLLSPVLAVLLLSACGPSEQKLKTIQLKEEIKKHDTIHSDKKLQHLYQRSVEYLIDQSMMRVSLKRSSISPYTDLIDSLKNDPENLFQAIQFQNTHFKGSYFSDVDSIDLRYISDNVYNVIYTLERTGFGDSISEEILFEYVLPYRLNSEPLEYWRNEVKDEILDSVYLIDNLLDAARYLVREMSARKKKYRIDYNSLPDLPYSSLKSLSIGRCKELADYSCFVMRAYGLPVAHDFTPNYANINMGHDWNAILLDENKSIPFIIPTSELGGFKASHFVLSKVYRNTFSVQQSSHVVNYGLVENNPGFLNNPFIIDVTDQYLSVFSVDIPIREHTLNSDVGYLYVFNNIDWTPIAWGEVEDDIVSFEKLGSADIGYYLPANKLGIQFNWPFRLNRNGQVEFFEPCLEEKIELKIKRKYPLYPKIQSYIDAMIGGEFHGSNDANFSTYDVIHRIEKSPGQYYDTVKLSNQKRYQFVRYSGPGISYGNIAEFEIYDETQNKIFGKPIALSELPGYEKEKAFDGDPLTRFQGVKGDEYWVGMAFSEPKQISEIRFMARTDYNIIVPDNEYEVFYWNRDWVSLGRKIADGYELNYKNVPSNALYLIRNHTAGNEERIFTYQNDKQVW